MVMDLLEGGNLRDRLKQLKQFSEQETANLMLQLFTALQHMHTVKIMHRDIKPENLMYLDQQCTKIILVDFGLASFWDLDMYLFPRCGTPGFVAPEIANNKAPDAHYTGLCDIFSLGCVMHSLLLGKSLFRGQTHLEVLNSNKECNIDLTQEAYLTLSDVALDFMRRCLEKQPQNRISIQNALSHPFIQTYSCSENIGAEALEFQTSHLDSSKQIEKYSNYLLKNPFQEKLIASKKNGKINKIDECIEEQAIEETPTLEKRAFDQNPKNQIVNPILQQQSQQQTKQQKSVSPKTKQIVRPTDPSIIIPQLQNLNSHVINNNPFQTSQEELEKSDVSASINQEGIQQQMLQQGEMKQLAMGFAPPQKLSTSPMIFISKTAQKQPHPQLQQQQQIQPQSEKKNNDLPEKQPQQQYISEFQPPTKTLTSPQISLVHKFEPLQNLQKK